MTRTDTTMTDETADPILNAMKVSSEANVRQLSPAAKRALAEAEERREAKRQKRIIEDVIRKHLGWLVVWGNVFGGLIGLGAYLLRDLLP